MKNLNASVILPTHRTDVSSLLRLQLTIELFLQQGFEVVIADNSGVKEKETYLKACLVMIWFLQQQKQTVNL
jgi:hypothetical protein